MLKGLFCNNFACILHTFCIQKFAVFYIDQPLASVFLHSLCKILQNYLISSAGAFGVSGRNAGHQAGPLAAGFAACAMTQHGYRPTGALMICTDRFLLHRISPPYPTISKAYIVLMSLNQEFFPKMNDS